MTNQDTTSIDEIAKILHETIEIEVWPEEGDYNLDDQSVKAAAEILANKYVAKSVEDKTITAITSKYFMATDPERLALADDIQALISDQVAKAKVDPKLSAAELALEYIQEHKNSKQSGELVGVTNFIGWLSEKARIATLNGVKNK